jgi:hypothetical protein
VAAIRDAPLHLRIGARGGKLGLHSPGDVDIGALLRKYFEQVRRDVIARYRVSHSGLATRFLIDIGEK